MGQNWMFDPVKRDYVLTQGSFVPTDRIEEQAYFVLTIPRGQWIYGKSGQGSDLYRFVGAKRTSNTEQLFAARCNQAIQSQLIDQGRALKVDTTNLASARNGTSNNIAIVPNQSNVSSQFRFNPV